jgi:hypothetical protein
MFVRRNQLASSVPRANPLVRSMPRSRTACFHVLRSFQTWMELSELASCSNRALIGHKPGPQIPIQVRVLYAYSSQAVLLEGKCEQSERGIIRGT